MIQRCFDRVSRIWRHLDNGVPTASAKGCMAVRGYALVRKDQAEELRAAYAAAAQKGATQGEQH